MLAVRLPDDTGVAEACPVAAVSYQGVWFRPESNPLEGSAEANPMRSVLAGYLVLAINEAWRAHYLRDAMRARRCIRLNDVNESSRIGGTQATNR